MLPGNPVRLTKGVLKLKPYSKTSTENDTSTLEIARQKNDTKDRLDTGSFGSCLLDLSRGIIKRK